ncbi:hypothetical protein [Brevibacillus laterosporus]|uniref:Uncharacterized protein n=2 Tax=Brevibacillus laterosporus TaxID=1465 RepID=A0AAP3DJG3_BRELA|nr:hypothetical protein [Brevibacillus laterosporus]MCR8981642.1 hypothetical protein [Brevibacillus laterosporus]MCZ0808797.1 hypothetical protein [Brevibacillus laterosporus]MCZ0827230.1 hypothetical protein [Brevibacillus laterosporus]MCZ0850986.1 hypothetical protein [Brevibacillus laterosporus]
MFSALAKAMTVIDKTDELKKIVGALAQKQVYVGIPEGGERPEEQGQPITNAQLLYAHTHGIRQKVMRDEMNPKVESGEMTYNKAYQMWIQTYGSPLWSSPPRPVIEPAIEHNKEALANQLRKVSEIALDGGDTEPELHKVGLMGQNFVRGWFTNPENGWAPNSPITEERKGSDKPLINTGELRKAITYVVKG